METEIERLIVDFSSIVIDENKIIKIIKIQKWYRGCMFRLKRLPLIMYKIKHFLLSKILYFQHKLMTEELIVVLMKILLLHYSFKNLIKE
jgi:hypothetical protein